MIPTRFPLLAICLGFLASARPASARLGETREQCTARYGEPVAEVAALLTTASGASYQKGEIRVRIEFLDGKAAFISFSRRGLRLDDRQKLLELNAGPLVWNPPAEFLGRLCWTAPATGKEPARHASAYMALENSYLDLATDAWTAAMKAQQAVQFAIQPRQPSHAAEIKPGTGAPASSAGTGPLEGF